MSQRAKGGGGPEEASRADLLGPEPAGAGPRPRTQKAPQDRPFRYPHRARDKAGCPFTFHVLRRRPRRREGEPTHVTTATTPTPGSRDRWYPLGTQGEGERHPLPSEANLRRHSFPRNRNGEGAVPLSPPPARLLHPPQWNPSRVGGGNNQEQRDSSNGRDGKNEG